LAVLLFIGWAATGVCPLLVAVVPAESVPQELISTAVGLNVALASLVGGVAGPGLAGWAADAWGPRAPIYMTLAAAALAAFLSLFVRETAPRRVAARREVVSQRRLSGT
jgi:sugar phosphate permease